MQDIEDYMDMTLNMFLEPGILDQIPPYEEFII